MLNKIQPSSLAGINVVDASGECGAYCGKLFADMGASVTRIGSSQDDDRRFTDLGKLWIQEDLRTESGMARFLDLASAADIVVESFAPNLLAMQGLSRERVMERSPKLIWVKIAPFGTRGPYKDFASADIVNMAMGGMLNLAGEPDRAPVVAYGEQSIKIASLYAAVGALMAYFECLSSGSGQYVEIPIQHAVATALENSIQFYDLQGVVRKRSGAGYAEAASGLFKCADGLVFLMAGRLSTVRGWNALIEWLNESPVAGVEELLHPQWQDASFKATPAYSSRFREIFESFAANKSRKELYLEAQKRGIALCPVNDIANVIEDPQLRARDFLKVVHLDDGRAVQLPGPPYRLSRTPAHLAVTGGAR